MAQGFIQAYPRHGAEVDVQERGGGVALVVPVRGFDGSVVEVICDAISVYVYHNCTELLCVGEMQGSHAGADESVPARQPGPRLVRDGSDTE